MSPEARDPASRQPRIFGLPPTTIALIVIFLAAVDSIATLKLLRGERGRELNPLMQWLVDYGDAPFVLFKLLLTAVCARWIVSRASHPYARVAALVALSIYLPIVGLHIANIAVLATR